MSILDALRTPRPKVLALDIAEQIPDWLPFASIKPIKRLKCIRNEERRLFEEHRRHAAPSCDKRPELHAISIGYTIKLEEAECSAAIIRSLFGEQLEISELVNTLESEVARLLPGRSALAGVLRKTASRSPLGTERVFQDMPNSIHQVAVYYARFANSLACIYMECHMTEAFTASVKNAEDNQRTSLAEWSWIGADGILFGTGRYSINIDKAIMQRVQVSIGRLAEEFHHWISSKCRTLKSPLLQRSITVFYNHDMNSGQSEDLRKQVSSSLGWLSRYGMSVWNTYSDGRSVLCWLSGPIKSFHCSFVLLQPRPLPLELPQSNEQIEQSSYLGGLQSCLAIASALLCEVKYLIGAIEDSRRKTYLYIDNNKDLSAAGTLTISRQKRIDGQLKRLRHEIGGEYTNILPFFLKPLQHFQSLHKTDGKRLDVALLEGTKTRLSIASEAGSLASETASDYLEVQNIFASYRLQQASSRFGCASVLLALLSLIAVIPVLRDIACEFRGAQVPGIDVGMLCKTAPPGMQPRSKLR